MAQTYTQGRPEYPTDILPWLKGNLGVAAGKLVVDLGAGTGKFTKLLVQTGADIIAVEPVEEMRLQLETTLPEVRLLPGCAEAIPLDTGSVDAVVCAQAFHWFASETALREIHRVLKPSGKLGLIWNVRDESVDWVSASLRLLPPTREMRRVFIRETGESRSTVDTLQRRKKLRLNISMSESPNK